MRAALVILGLLYSTVLLGERPNVIVILTDDQGWGDLSFTGNTNLDTPHIDRLGREGVFFEHFYVQAVCSPTRAEFLTGRYHPRLGVYDTSAGAERMNVGETTIAEVFKRAGYVTGAFGKWHNGSQGPYHPNARGFDEYYGFTSGHWGSYFDAQRIDHNGRLVESEGYLTDDLTTKAMEFMTAHRDESFFVYLPLPTPHSPMQAPDRWWQKFAEAELKMRHREPEREDYLHLRAALAMVENIDWNVGRVMAHLESLGLNDNTLVVFFSDNGPNGWRWNADMKGRKGSNDEGGLRSPLFMRWPGGLPANRVIPQIAGAIDLLPTLAELADIRYETRKPLDGLSLEPLIRGTRHWPERYLFSHWNGGISVRRDRFRLDREGALFDLKNDPGQYHDVAVLYPEIHDTLLRARADWIADVMEGAITAAVEDPRPIPIGYAPLRFTHLPARDARASGDLMRSNRWPNDSFFTNWTSEDDMLYWDVEVLTAGRYAVTLHCTAPASAVGTEVTVALGASTLSSLITEAHDPPLRGGEHDRYPRVESYVKDFKPLRMGVITLPAGRGTLRLLQTEVAGEGIDFRLLEFERLD